MALRAQNMSINYLLKFLTETRKTNPITVHSGYVQYSHSIHHCFSVGDDRALSRGCLGPDAESMPAVFPCTVKEKLA